MKTTGLALLAMGATLRAVAASAIATAPTPAPATPSTAAPANSPQPTPKPTPTLRESVDALSPKEVTKSIDVLKSNFLSPNALNDDSVARATLEGLLQRLAPGATIASAQQPQSPNEPFRSEALDATAYLRLGSLTTVNLTELDTALNLLNEKGGVDSIILDLRATPPSNDFQVAAQVAMRFCAKGKMLFSVGKTPKEERFASTRDPLFQKLLIVMVSEETAGATEVLAATLRENARAMLVGTNTKGQGVQLADFPIDGTNLLRIAVAPVVLPSGKSFYPVGVKVDLPVGVSPETRRELLRLELEDGAGKYVFETERPKRNEAALVAGTNPEYDSAQLAQRRASAKAVPRDLELQRALDLVTTISVYEGKRSEQ